MKWNIFEKLTGKPVEDPNAWRFRTSIMCNGCIAKVKPILDGTEGISSWKVNLDTPDRVLTVVSNGITEDELLALIRNAGFTIERV